MGINYVQSAAVEASVVTSLTVNISATSGGNLLIVSTGTGTATVSSITDSGGDAFSVSKVSRAKLTGSGTIRTSGSYAFDIAAGSTSVTVNTSNNSPTVVVVAEYSGTGAADPFLASANSGASSATKVSAGAMTNATSGSLFCGFMCNVFGALTITAETGWNDRQNSAAGSMAFDYEDIITSGTENPSWTINSSTTSVIPIGMTFTAAPIAPGLCEDEGIQYENIYYW